MFLGYSNMVHNTTHQGSSGFPWVPPGSPGFPFSEVFRPYLKEVIAPGYETGSFMCDQCPAELRSKKSLINHLKVIHDESKAGLKYTCHECQLDFSGSRYLICHYKKIHNEIPPDFKDQKQYLCDQCPDVFLTKHSLHLHTLR